MKKSRRVLTDEQIKWAVEKYREFYTIEEIAHALHVTPQTLCNTWRFINHERKKRVLVYEKKD